MTEFKSLHPREYQILNSQSPRSRVFELQYLWSDFQKYHGKTIFNKIIIQFLESMRTWDVSILED